MIKRIFILLPLFLGACSLPDEELVKESAEWALCYEKLDGDYAEIQVNGHDQTPKVSSRFGKLQLTYDKVDGKDICVKIVYSRTKDHKGLLVTPSVRNDEEGGRRWHLV